MDVEDLAVLVLVLQSDYAFQLVIRLRNVRIVDYKVDGKDGDRATFADLGRKVVAAQAGDGATPVVIAADKGVRYELVVRAMDVLNRAGVKRVGLAVKSGVSS